MKYLPGFVFAIVLGLAAVCEAAPGDAYAVTYYGPLGSPAASDAFNDHYHFSGQPRRIGPGVYRGALTSDFNFNGTYVYYAFFDYTVWQGIYYNPQLGESFQANGTVMGGKLSGTGVFQSFTSPQLNGFYLIDGFPDAICN